MENILVENKFGTGAKLHSPRKHKKIHRKRKFIGSAAPYDWTKPLVRNYNQPIKNQYQAGMCGGELFSQAMQIYRTLVLGLPFEELSEISFYSQNYLKGGGMSVQDMQNGAAFKGLTAFRNVPTPVNCTETQAESIAWENISTLKDCLIRAGIQMVSVPIQIDAMAQAIRDHYCLGMCFGGTNNGTWLTAYPKAPQPGSQPQWGHFMEYCPSQPVISGKKSLDCYQSWGDGVGDKGIQHIDEDFINSGFVYDVFTFVKHTFDQNLCFGMANDDVKYLQVKLGIPATTLGFGIFGPKTLAAVKSYQSANGIPATGYVGTLTKLSLNK